MATHEEILLARRAEILDQLNPKQASSEAVGLLDSYKKHFNGFIDAGSHKLLDTASGFRNLLSSVGNTVQDETMRELGEKPLPHQEHENAVEALRHRLEPSIGKRKSPSTPSEYAGSALASLVSPGGMASKGLAALTAGVDVLGNALHQTGASEGVAHGAAALTPVAAQIAKAVASKGKALLGSGLNKALKIDPHAVSAFERVGVTPTLGDISNSKGLHSVQTSVEQLPIAGKALRNATEAQTEGIMKTLGQGEYGPDLSKTKASEIALKGAKSHQKAKNLEHTAAYSQVEEDLAKLPDTLVDIGPLYHLAARESSKLKSPGMVERFQETPYGRWLSKILDSSGSFGGKLPYEELIQIKRDIRNKISTHGLIGKEDQGQLKQITKFIDHSLKDMDAKFKTLGPESYKNWKTHRKEYALYAQEDIPKLNEIYKADKKSAVDVFLNLVADTKKGGEKLKLSLHHLSPEDQHDLLLKVHQKLGSYQEGIPFSPVIWKKRFEGLEPQAQKILMSHLSPAEKSKLRATSTVITRRQNVQKQANTSRTAHHAALYGLGSTTFRGLGALATGNPLPLAKLGIGAALGKVAGHAFTAPKVINWIAKKHHPVSSINPKSLAPLTAPSQAHHLDTQDEQYKDLLLKRRAVILKQLQQ